MRKPVKSFFLSLIALILIAMPAYASPLGEALNAISDGKDKVVMDLVNKDPSLAKAKTDDGQTLLHRAAYWGRTSVAELLIKKGAVVNAADSDGRTPLHTAAMLGHIPVAELLLKNGAAINAKDKRGNTPFAFADRYLRKDMASFLKKNGGH